MLLCQVDSEIQPDLNLPWLNTDQIGADFFHHLLSGETLLEMLFVVRVQRFDFLHRVLFLRSRTSEMCEAQRRHRDNLAIHGIVVVFDKPAFIRLLPHRQTRT